jgi:hypothetical protein
MTCRFKRLPLWLSKVDDRNVVNDSPALRVCGRCSVTSLRVFYSIPKLVRLRAEHRRGSFFTRPLPIRAT